MFTCADSLQWQVTQWVHYQCQPTEENEVPTQEQSLIAFRQEVARSLDLGSEWSVDDVHRKYQESWAARRGREGPQMMDKKVLIVGSHSVGDMYFDYILRDLLREVISRLVFTTIISCLQVNITFFLCFSTVRSQ